MAIRKSKINIDTEERCDFDNMMNDVENEVEEQQAEDGLVNRVPPMYINDRCLLSSGKCSNHGKGHI